VSSVRVDRDLAAEIGTSTRNFEPSTTNWIFLNRKSIAKTLRVRYPGKPKAAPFDAIADNRFDYDISHCVHSKKVLCCKYQFLVKLAAIINRDRCWGMVMHSQDLKAMMVDVLMRDRLVDRS
jgi:hypothetical protein